VPSHISAAQTKPSASVSIAWFARGVAVSTWRHWFYPIYGVFLAAIVFLAALLELSRPQGKPMLAE